MSRKRTHLLLVVAAIAAACGATTSRVRADVISPAAAVNDTWVRQSSPNSVYQNDSLSTWVTEGGSNTARYALVQFNLAGISTPITSATIQLESLGGSASTGPGPAAAVTLTPAFWVDSSVLPGDLSTMNWTGYTTTIQPAQQQFTSLGGVNLAQGDVRPGTYATLGSASAPDLTALNNIRQAGGTVTMVFQASAGQQDWGDVEAWHAPAKLFINQAAPESDNLTLQVNRFSGNVSISNPAHSTAFSLDGYQITSASGALIPDPTHTAGVGWDSLANAGKPGWQEVNPTATGLSELNLSSSTSIAPGATLNLGHAVAPFSTQDLQFQYSLPNGTLATNAFVKYTGGVQLVVHTLVSNHSASVLGTAAVLNNPESVAITTDGYMIQSAAGSLSTAGFHGYASGGVAGWESVSPSANALSELNLSSSSAIAAGNGRALGAAYTAGATQDLTFQYNVVGHGLFTGDVQYITEVAGDANHDGVVNGLDIALIASNWLHGGAGKGDVNYDNVVNGLDIALVASHWLNAIGGSGSSGSSANASAVPEPSSIGLMAMGALVVCCRYRSRRRD